MDLMGIVSIVTTIVTVASIIAAVTPTPKDDEWIAKLYKFVDLLAVNIGWLPAVAAALSIVWTVIRISETDTVKGWFNAGD